MSMQALRVELACIVIAFLLPTFGKRSQDQGSTSRKRSRLTRLDDVVLKLSSDCDESAAALRNAVQTLQTGGQVEIRKLCKPWGVRLGERKNNGKRCPRAINVLKSELENTLIEEAKKHFRAKEITADEEATISIKSLDDVVLKLSSDCDESTAALRNAVQTCLLYTSPSPRD